MPRGDEGWRNVPPERAGMEIRFHDFGEPSRGLSRFSSAIDAERFGAIIGR